MRAGYLGSTTNQIMVLATFLPLVAGRFGLAPTSTRHTTTGLKLLPEDKSTGLYSADPAGETAAVVERRWDAGMGGCTWLQPPVAPRPANRSPCCTTQASTLWTCWRWAVSCKGVLQCLMS